LLYKKEKLKLAKMLKVKNSVFQKRLRVKFWWAH